MSKNCYPILFVVCLSLMAMSSPQSAKWKGTIQEVEGVAIVRNPKKPLYSEEIVIFEEELSIGVTEGPEEYILNHILSFAADDEGNIFILDMKPFRVKVYDNQGNHLRSIDSQGRTVRRIEKEHAALRVSENYKEQYFERLPPSISKTSQVFSSHFPAFDQFFTDDKGRLYVKSYEKIKGTDKYIIDVFDPEGRFLCQTALRVGDEISLDQDKYVIKDNKLYSSETDAEGFFVLKRYGIIWKN